MNISPVCTGAPADERSPVEERCYELLGGLGIPFTRVDHDEAMTMADLHDADLALGCRICKNLFLTNRQQTDFYLLLMPGDKPFKTKYLSSQLGCSRLSFADEDKLFELLGVYPGSASILGLVSDTSGRVRLVIDEDLKREEFFGCHPCRNTSTLCMKTDDVLNTLIPALGHAPTFVELPRETESV